MPATSPACRMVPALAALLVLAPPAPSRAAPEGASEHELRLHLTLSRKPHGTEAERDRIRELEEELLGLLAASDARLVRDTWSDGTCVITIAARDARPTWAAIEGAVRALGPRPGSYAVLRPGPPGMPEERVPLDAPAAPTPRP